MKYIGKRISLKQKEAELSIVILSLTNKTKNSLLFIWLLLWTLSGITVLVYYFKIADHNTKAAIIVWFGFWVYFEYMIAKALLWRKYGKEIIKLRDNKLLYKRDIAGKGKIRVFEFNFMKDLRIIEEKSNSFVENLNNSYWVIAGEKLGFDYYGKEIKIGIQLDEQDAIALKNELKKRI